MREKIKNKKGFSLMELIIALAIFAVIMTSTVQIFSAMVSGYRKTKAIQRDLEDAQFVTGLMAKSMRASSAVNCGGSKCSSAGSGNYTTLRIFDYSQHQCIEYAISGNKLSRKAVAPGDSSPNLISDADLATWCGGSAVTGAGGSPNYPAPDFSSATVQNLVSDVYAGSFYVAPSSSSQAGKVTISLKICPNAVCNGNPSDEADIQTTVSLRNYIEIAN